MKKAPEIREVKSKRHPGLIAGYRVRGVAEIILCKKAARDIAYFIAKGYTAIYWESRVHDFNNTRPDGWLGKTKGEHRGLFVSIHWCDSVDCQRQWA